MVESYKLRSKILSAQVSLLKEYKSFADFQSPFISVNISLGSTYCFIVGLKRKPHEMFEASKCLLRDKAIVGHS